MSSVQSVNQSLEFKVSALKSSKAMSRRIESVRELMRLRNLDALIVPSEDAHQSEYTSLWDNRRQFMTNFSGSAGFAVLLAKDFTFKKSSDSSQTESSKSPASKEKLSSTFTLESAANSDNSKATEFNSNEQSLEKDDASNKSYSGALWTDGRYFLQAERQLDPNYWLLMRSGEPGTASKEAFLLEYLQPNGRVGVDAKTISFDAANRLKKALSKNTNNSNSSSPGLQLVLLEEPVNIVDLVWDQDAIDTHPAKSLNPINLLSIDFAGQEALEKISLLRKSLLESEKSFGILISGLDEIAWLFNLRGSDVQCNPVFFAFAFIPAQSSSNPILYLDHPERLSAEAAEHLRKLNVKILSYNQVYTDLGHGGHLYNSIIQSNAPIMTGASTCNAALIGALFSVQEEKNICLIESKSVTPLELSKSIKNKVEIEGFRQSHIRDGAALVRYFAYLEAFLKNPDYQFSDLNDSVKDAMPKGKSIDEWEGAVWLEAFRKDVGGDHFRGLSFETISGSGPNGAIIHYKPEMDGSLAITADQMYLCDSGAQYLDGTTDVTRTLHYGHPTDIERDAFTRVLMGHIALSKVIFPKGTTGLQLDALARAPLWAASLDYRHGTGHGVGHFLNVHEGPHSISFRPSSNGQALLPGMTVTNEPGYYKDGHFGIRIENVMIVQPVNHHKDNGPDALSASSFLCFETVTMVPIQTSLIKIEMLNAGEKEWINDYHHQVRSLLSPLLEKDPIALAYLHRQTERI